jgi:glycine/D-amino acid oxidase-like deaminating enzyme
VCRWRAAPGYFADFERTAGLPILRPVQVSEVRPEPDGSLVVASDRGSWITRAIINATGTWTNPVLPHYPGQETFRGLQLHTHDYVSADRLAGRRVAAVDAIVWATGFRAALAHLEPLALRTATGGIRMTGTQVAADPRVHLVGFGPSQSTVGANRAGRDAVTTLVKYLDRTSPAYPR